MSEVLVNTLEKGQKFQVSEKTKIRLNTNGSGVIDFEVESETEFIVEWKNAKTVAASATNHPTYSKKFKGFRFPHSLKVNAKK